MEGTAIKRILVVDDHETVRATLKEILESRGYLTDMAVDGNDGLEKLKAAEYDLIIIDVNMPGMDGIDFFNEVARRQPFYRDKALFMTGDPTGEFEAVRLFVQTDKVMKKPFTVDELFNNIRLILG